MIYTFWAIILTAKSAVTKRNPFKMERGMDFFYDVVDWVGGYPYEYATIQEIKDFVQTHGFKIIKTIPAKVPTGCNEFAFIKK
jgi:2-polyprenyl-6-hydroxyphenyl methylase/3-demethylubiquinone-9 3-methyltransferase